MAENSSIEWCDSTFNPWIGCTRVSPACDDCYAARSTPARTLGVAWGPGEPRRRTSAANWKQPELWQRQAAEFHAAHGRRRRVFCASLADVFDNEVPDEWRADLFTLIAQTPDLDWLILTKRVGNVERMLKDIVHGADEDLTVLDMMGERGGWYPNVWLGITVVNQAEVDRDIPKLLTVPARVRFLSVEPMLGPISLDCWPVYGEDERPLLHWVICGGESGPKARPMHPDWARSLRDQCAAAGVPFLFKQWGEWTEQDDSGLPGVRTVHEGAPEFESEADKCDAFMAADGHLVEDIEATRRGIGYRGLVRAGKKAAGRLLDGRTHDGFPLP